MDVACSMCGRGPDDEQPVVLWSAESTGAGTVRTCPDCTRRHVRAIEAKLEQEWW